MSEQFTLDIGAQTEDLLYFEPGQLIPWPELNPRQHFDPDKMHEIEESIREHGVLQNIVVHDTGTFPKWIVAGETRWRCASAVGRRLPARVRLFTLAQAHRIALLENMQRNDLTPMEEARGFKRQLELEPDLSQSELGATFGKDQSYVSDRIRLLELSEPMQELIDQKVILPTHARDHLLPCRKEPGADEIFETIFNMIGARPDPSAQVDGVWLAKITAHLRGVCKPTPSEPVEEKPAPAKASPRSASEADERKAGVPSATCIDCGCTDDKPCKGGCSWRAVDRKTRRGLCSACCVTSFTAAEARKMLNQATKPAAQQALAVDDHQETEATNETDTAKPEEVSAPADANDVPTPSLDPVAQETDAGAEAVDSVDDAAAAAPPVNTAEESAEHVAPESVADAAQEPDLTGTLIGSIEPLLPGHSVTLQLVPMGSRGTIVTLTAKRLGKGRGALEPFTHTFESMVKAHEFLPPMLQAYVDELMERNAVIGGE